MPTPELSEHLWTGKGLVGLVRKGNLPGGGFQYKSGARESFVETALPVGPAAFGQPLDSRTLARSEALRASPGLLAAQRGVPEVVLVDEGLFGKIQGVDDRLATGRFGAANLETNHLADLQVLSKTT